MTQIRAIATRAYVKYVPRIGRVPAPMAADFLSYVLNHQTRLAVSAGTVIGYLIAYPRDDDYFVENVAVDPLAAGKGAGKVLMVAAEKSAIELGFRCVRLYTNVRMWENFAFYRALGYHKTHEVKEAGFRRIYFEKECFQA